MGVGWDETVAGGRCGGRRLDRGLRNFDSQGKRTVSSCLLPSPTKDEATSLYTYVTHTGGRALIHEASDVHRAMHVWKVQRRHWNDEPPMSSRREGKYLEWHESRIAKERSTKG